MKNLPTAQQFYTFSVELYSYGEISKICIDLQDRYGFDTNLALLFFWLDLHALTPTACDMETLNRTAAQWTAQKLDPHRARRRAAKGGPSYESLKAEELKLEQEAQAAMLACFDSPIQTGGSDLLAAYLGSLAIPRLEVKSLLASLSAAIKTSSA